jgi:hypothetical protein
MCSVQSEKITETSNARLLSDQYQWTVYVILNYDEDYVQDNSTDHGSDLLALILSGESGANTTSMLKEALEEELENTTTNGLVIEIDNVQEVLTITIYANDVIVTEDSVDNNTIVFDGVVVLPDWVPVENITFVETTTTTTTTTTSTTTTTKPADITTAPPLTYTRSTASVITTNILITTTTTTTTTTSTTSTK